MAEASRWHRGGYVISIFGHFCAW
uniref:Isoform 4 of Polycystin-2-like protein 2 n=1 Tax=Homo sapiens TaxID=9606 RepID=Q9NZM6-4